MAFVIVVLIVPSVLIQVVGCVIIVEIEGTTKGVKACSVVLVHPFISVTVTPIIEGVDGIITLIDVVVNPLLHRY